MIEFLKHHWVIGLSIVLAIIATIGSTIRSVVWMSDLSINGYFPGIGGDISQPHWLSYGGGWFTVYEEHPAWPTLGIPAEWRLVYLGILFNILFYGVIFYLVIFIIRGLFKLKPAPDKGPDRIKE